MNLNKRKLILRGGIVIHLTHQVLDAMFGGLPRKQFKIEVEGVILKQQ